MIERCAVTVAAERPLDGVLPTLSAREVAILARDALEALEMAPSLGRRALEREVRAGDWALDVLVAFRVRLIQDHRQRRNEALAAAMAELVDLTIEAIAESDDRSPCLYYHDILYHAAVSLARRGDRTAITRQIESVAEELHDGRDSNVRSALRDLGLVYLDLHEHQTGLALLTELQRDDPSDLWGYNALAFGLQHSGLGSLARFAAERGLELARRDGDPMGLTEQLAQVRRDLASASDRSDAPADAIAALREAIELPFDPTYAPAAPAELAARLVPTLATARVKVLPPMPSEDDLARIAAGLRGFLGGTPAAAATPRPPSPVPLGAALGVTARAPKIGRNSPCLCGSGKKYKKCCLRE